MYEVSDVSGLVEDGCAVDFEGGSKVAGFLCDSGVCWFFVSEGQEVSIVLSEDVMDAMDQIRKALEGKKNTGPVH